MLDYDPAKGGYVVPLDKARLESAPRYGADDIPDYTSEYSRNINSHYGL
jgi:hypothetical protein